MLIVVNHLGKYRMRKFILILLGCFFLFSVSSTYAVTPKKWTFLIFINGNNSLDRFSKINIKQMEKIGSDDQVNVVVQWASYSRRKTVRMLIEKSPNPSEITSPVLESLGVVDMGDYRNLQDFIKWGIEHFPAEHYFIDVWNHGNGWHLTKTLQGKNLRTNIVNDISFDDISGNHISTEELGQVMATTAQMIGHKVDIYGSDACLMAMAEVANEMSDAVNYFVGSQEVEPGMGWPYADLLSRWTTIPNATPEQVSKILVNAYVKSYQGGSSGSHQVTFSALDLNKLGDFNKSLETLSTDIRKLSATERAQVLSAVNETQTFASQDYKDIIDFTNHLSALAIKGLSNEEINDVQEKAKNVIVANEGTEDYSNATGVSMWMPIYDGDYNRYAERYHGLKFDANTHWSAALEALLQGNH